MTETTKPHGAAAFARHRGGSVGMMLAVSIIPIVALTGAALDYSRASEAKTALQKMTDSAALAAAVAARDGAKSPEKVALDVVSGQVKAPKSPIRDVKAHYSAKQGQHTVATSATVETTLMKSLGWKGMTISSKATAAATAVPRSEPTEIVFVFDVSVSMTWGSRWSEAVAAVKGLLQNLKGTGSSEFYATLVPMTDRINVSSVGPSVASWMQSPPPPGWTGCLEPREVPEPGFPHALSDAPPTHSNRFVASAPGNYLPQDPIPGSPPWAPVCSSSTLSGPTANPDVITAGLNSLHPIGTGRLDEGMVWAWRLLSEKWRGRWNAGANYPGKAKQRKKIVVFLSDGNTEAYAYEVGGVKGKSYGFNMGSQMGFAHFVEICRKMKKTGIEIYTVQLPGNENFSSFMKDCATGSDHYAFADSVETFKLALGKIGPVGASGVRLIK